MFYCFCKIERSGNRTLPPTWWNLPELGSAARWPGHRVFIFPQSLNSPYCFHSTGNEWFIYPWTCAITFLKVEKYFS